MKRLVSISFWALAGLLVLPAGTALGQYSPYNQVRPNNTYVRPPVLSPYLNLLPVRPPAVNYYLNVVPEMDRRAQFNSINNQLLDLERRQAAPAPVEEPLVPTLESTGHPVGFLNLSPYYTVGSGSPSTAAASAGATGLTGSNTNARPPSRGHRGGR
jgi:hypothetical protein